jgi:hypothetical protein
MKKIILTLFVISAGLFFASCVNPVIPDPTDTSYTVSFDPQGGEVNPASLTVDAGETIANLPAPSRGGYSFGGWFTGAGGTGNQFTSATTVNRDI